MKPPVNQLADDGEKMDLDKDFYAEGGFVKFDRKMEGPVPDTRASWWVVCCNWLVGGWWRELSVCQKKLVLPVSVKLPV